MRVDERLAQRADVLRRDDQAGLARTHRLGQRADVGGDDGQAGGRRLHQDHGEALAETRQDEQVSLGEEAE